VVRSSDLLSAGCEFDSRLYVHCAAGLVLVGG